jgi:hypothetical protein
MPAALGRARGAPPPFKDELIDAPAECHISGARVPKFLDTCLTAEERRFVERRKK